MAYLTQGEFREAIEILATDIGLQRLRDKLVRMNALVSRRRVSSPAALADQLYMLTSALRKQVPATFAFHGIWAESLNEKLGKESEEQLEELAKAVNDCLDDSEEIIPEKGDELERALGAYAQPLAEKVGERAAYLDMLLKAVPGVAKRLREEGLPKPPPPSAAARETPAEAPPSGEAEPSDEGEK